MNFCFECGLDFVPKRNSTGKFCSLNCAKEYSKRDKHLTPLSRLGYGGKGTKRVRLEKVLNELEEDKWSDFSEHYRANVFFNPEINVETKKKGDYVRKLCREFLKHNIK